MNYRYVIFVEKWENAVPLIQFMQSLNLCNLTIVKSFADYPSSEIKQQADSLKELKLDPDEMFFVWEVPFERSVEVIGATMKSKFTFKLVLSPRRNHNQITTNSSAQTGFDLSALSTCSFHQAARPNPEPTSTVDVSPPPAKRAHVDVDINETLKQTAEVKVLREEVISDWSTSVSNSETNQTMPTNNEPLMGYESQNDDIEENIIDQAKKYKTVECKLCDRYVSNTPYILSSHAERFHTMYRPYQCALCYDLFSPKMIRYHVSKAHAGQYAKKEDIIRNIRSEKTNEELEEVVKQCFPNSDKFYKMSLVSTALVDMN